VNSIAHDLEDLASLWAEDPSSNEKLDFAVLAERASKRAGFLDYAEQGVAALLALGVIIGLALQPRPAMITVGLIAVASLGWFSWKRRTLKQLSMSLASNDRVTLLGTEIKRARTDLQRATLGFWVVLPGTLLGSLLVYSFVVGGDLANFVETLRASVTTFPQGPVLIGLILLVFEQQFRLVKRVQSELERLESLADEYREEMRLDLLASD
jgi:hypothetical protein